MKLMIILSLLSFVALSAEFSFSVTKESKGFACTKARGESRRLINAKCEKEKKIVDWKEIKISECEIKDLGPAKFKATYKYTYECIEKE